MCELPAIPYTMKQHSMGKLYTLWNPNARSGSALTRVILGRWGKIKKKKICFLARRTLHIMWHKNHWREEKAP